MILLCGRQNILWPEDVKCPIVVGLGGKDRIVPSKPLRRYLLAHSTFATSFSSLQGVNMNSVEGLINCGGSCANGRATGGGGCENDQHSGGKRTLVRGPTPLHSGPGSPFGGHVTAAVSGSSSINGNGGVFALAMDEDAVGDNVGINNVANIRRSGGVAKRVELMYWPNAVHGEALARPSMLDEFIRVATRQEQAFSTS